VFFEEWDDPLISAIGWVSELIEAAGGIDIFADHAGSPAAKDRIVTAAEVVARRPDIIIGSLVRQEIPAGTGAGAAGLWRCPRRAGWRGL
jgi:iron complex transport system substrate-binding protein